MIPLALAAATVVAFLPALQGEFVSWDDDRNFIENPNYRGLGWPQLQWMWTTTLMGHYIPVTWMTLGWDYVLWGMDPAGYRATNLALHAANVALVHVTALRLLGPGTPADGAGPASRPRMLGAAAAALFFGVHPLRVESVAWVTERRDVLSLFFMLLALLLYLRAARGSAFVRWYGLALLAFVLGLLSKSIAVTVPALLLIVNTYPLRRLGGAAGWWNPGARRVYAEVLPFAVLALGMGVVSLVALKPPEQLDGAGKIAVSAYALTFYLWKTLVPTGLAPLYELPARIDPWETRFVVGYMVAAASLAFVPVAWRRRPGAATAWLAFLVLLLPLIGVVQNGPQIAADRYTYHAAPALALIAGAGVAAAARRRFAPAAVAAAVVLLLLAARTWQQTFVWRDSEALWTQVLRVDPRSPVAHVDLANVRMEQGRVQDAAALYERALALHPGYAEAHNNLGVILAAQGRLDDAIRRYERALALEPGHVEAHVNLGIALGARGDSDGAISHFRRALALNPDAADAHINWGNTLVRAARPADALPHYAAAVRIRANADAHLNWGVAHARLGQLDPAIEQFERALALDPLNADAAEYLRRARELRQQAGGR